MGLGQWYLSGLPPMPPRKPVKHLSAAHYWVTYITLTNNNIYYATFVKNLPTMQETWEDPLQEGMATHSSILAWRISMDRWAWWAAVHGVAKCRTLLSNSAQLMTCYLSSSKYFFLIYLFGFLTVLGLPCCARAFSNWGEWGLLSSCSAQASHCGGFFCCGAQALGARTQ